jgi:uncharacterized protein YjdB
VTWLVTSGTAYATINATTGVLTAADNGSVTVRATATDGSNVYGSATITITGQVIPVTGIVVTGEGGVSLITNLGGTLQLSAAVLPANATNPSVTWSVSSGTDKASISPAGLVTALGNGTAVARATANDGSGIFGTLTITISNQVIPVTGITVTGTGGATTISTDGGTLQMVSTVLPANASNKTVTWSVTSGTAYATINATTGVLTAADNGSVTVRATATDGSNVYGSATITITGQVIPVTGIVVTGEGGVSLITNLGGTLQLSAAVLPANATNPSVTWSVSSGTDKASISPAGLVTALGNGTAVARATANDGSGIFGTLTITISNQVIEVEEILVTSENGSNAITTNDGTLQLLATVLPAEATEKSVTWSIVEGSGYASISPTGLITAISNGAITAEARANDDSGVTGTIGILIEINNEAPFIAIVDDNELKFPMDESYLGCQISIYNLYGRLFGVKMVDSNLVVFDITKFSPGLYIGVLSNKMIIKTLKVIIP